jgi:hypothetical protein
VEIDAARLVAAAEQDDSMLDWLERADELRRAIAVAKPYEHWIETDLAAVTLFCRLDQAALAGAMLKGSSLKGLCRSIVLAKHDEGLLAAETFLREHPEIFFPAEPLASATLEACRPDLEDDLDLWRTTLIHRCLQEAMEEVELVGVADRRYSPEANSLPEPAHYNGALSPRSQPADCIPRFDVAAKTAAAGPLLRTCRFRSTDQRYQGVLVSDWTSGDSHVEVVFRRDADHSIALEFVGRPVRFCGVPAVIDTAGYARFAISDLRAALNSGLPDQLEGPDELAWEAE